MIPTNDFQPIDELDLGPIKFKLMHKSGEGWSEARANAVEREYRRFLALMKKYAGEHVSPTVDVDTFWHYHILDTLKYAADCEQAFGYFLHHFPYVGMRGEEDEEALQRMGDRMRAVYEETFGEGYDAAARRCAELAGGAGQAHAAQDGAAANAAYCGVTAAEPAYCGVTAAEPAYCGVTAKPAYCGVTAKPAYCGVTAKPAYCGVTAKPAYCGVTAKPAYCGVAAKPAYCGVTVKPAYCGVTAKPAYCGVTAKAAYCGVTATTAYGEATGPGASSAAMPAEHRPGFYMERPALH